MKDFFGILSAIIGTLAFFPYLKDIYHRKTQPHLYTWMIFTLVQGTSTIAIWYGGGGIGALELTIGTFFVAGIFISAFSHGTKNVTRFDTALLIVALIGIIIWWATKNPVIAVLMACAIDLLACIPTFRKTYQEPWSETMITWFVFVVGNIFSLLALKQYNVLTLSYLITISAADLLLAMICLIRRQTLSK